MVEYLINLAKLMIMFHGLFTSLKNPCFNFLSRVSKAPRLHVTSFENNHFFIIIWGFQIINHQRKTKRFGFIFLIELRNHSLK